MTRKLGARTLIRPNYLKTFRYDQPPDIKETLLAVKKGKYSLENEEKQLCDILKDLNHNPN
jgi:hypothetical protein